MVRVCIGSSERTLNDVTENWVREQIGRRRSANEEICLRVIINTSELNLHLSTPGCGRAEGRRVPNPLERRIADSWERHRMNEDEFASHAVMSFLAEVQPHA